MRSINYLLIAVLLHGGCGSVLGQNEIPTLTLEQVLSIRQEADQGDAVAQLKLGVLYQNGWGGLPQHYQLAVKWWRKAAEQGDAKAQKNLGNMYRAGEGVPQDYVLAHKWYNLAAAQEVKGVKLAAKEGREASVQRMTPSQIQEAWKLAREFKPKKEKPKKENP